MGGVHSFVVNNHLYVPRPPNFTPFTTSKYYIWFTMRASFYKSSWVSPWGVGFCVWACHFTYPIIRPEIETTGGHWSLSEHLGQMATQVWICLDNIYYMMYIGGLANIPLTGQLSGQISILLSVFKTMYHIFSHAQMQACYDRVRASSLKTVQSLTGSHRQGTGRRSGTPRRVRFSRDGRLLTPLSSPRHSPVSRNADSSRGTQL